MGDLDLIKNVLAAMPYAAKLGVTAQLDDDGRLVCTMPFHENHIGNAQLPALHGGSLASFLEITAILQLAHEQACLLYTSPSPRDRTRSRMPSSA